MAEFIHSVLAQNISVTAGTTVSYDLPVNPLSHVYLTLKFAQNQANTQLTWTNVAAMLSKVEVLFKGSAIFSANGLDTEVLAGMMLGFVPYANNVAGVDNDLLHFTFLIPFGRFPYSPKECFPRSTRGELRLQITYAASFTQIDAVSLQAETVELPDANPSQYMRTTTLSVTPAAAGEMDVELPLGNKIAAVLFFGTTVPVTTTATRTLTYTQLLVDNQRRYFSQTNFETQRSLMALKHRPMVEHGAHNHQIDGASFAQYMESSAQKYMSDQSNLHLMWDFDPLGDDTYLLETAGKSDVVARINAGDTSALRVLPVELVGV